MRQLCYFLVFLFVGAPTSAQPLPELIPYTDGHLWGYADTNGIIRIDPRWPGVAFFNGNLAVVMVGDSLRSPGNSTYALINKKGDYLIPPSRHWNGVYNGWRGILNARDDDGRWGMIDTGNNVVIPFAWQPTSVSVSPDSLYKAVARDGLTGVIDRTNKLIVPCRYPYISSMGAVNGVMAFMVTDTFTIPRPNLYGVVNALGKTLVPVGYDNIEYGSWMEGDGFRTRKAVRSKNPNQPDYQYGFISTTDTTLKTGNATSNNYIGRYTRQGNYYLYRQNNTGYALLDTNKKVVIPCCKAIAANADTIFLFEQKNDDQTETVINTYLNAHTLKPLAAPKVVTYYQEEVWYAPPAGMCGNGVRAWQEARNHENTRPRVNYEGRYTSRYFRDSLLLEVQGYTGDGPFPGAGGYGRPGGYLADMSVRVPRDYFQPVVKPGEYVTVHSSSMKDSLGAFRYQPGYSAVADEYARYVVPPLPAGYYIAGFNPDDSLVTARSSGNNGALFNTKGILLAEIKGKEPRGAFRWSGKIYTFVVASSEVHRNDFDYGDRYVIEKIKLADGTGMILPALSAYRVTGAIKQDGRITALALTDSAGRMGIFSPGGDDLYPEVNFRYNFLNASPEGLLFARDSINRSGKLIDRHNRDRLNGLRLQTMLEATDISPNDYFRQQPPYQNKRVAGLYLATTPASDSDHKSTRFYVDRHGRIYKAGFMTIHREEPPRKRKTAKAYL